MDSNIAEMMILTDVWTQEGWEVFAVPVPVYLGLLGELKEKFLPWHRASIIQCSDCFALCVPIGDEAQSNGIMLVKVNKSILEILLGPASVFRHVKACCGMSAEDLFPDVLLRMIQSRDVERNEFGERVWTEPESVLLWNGQAYVQKTAHSRPAVLIRADGKALAPLLINGEPIAPTIRIGHLPELN